MTQKEEKLLDELKDFFTNKYDKEWETKFRGYTTRLVKDGHITKQVIDEYLEYEEPNKIVQKFVNFKTKKNKTSDTIKEIDKSSQSNTSFSDGCGNSVSSRGDGCGNSTSSRSTSSRSDGCGGGYSRSSC